MHDDPDLGAERRVKQSTRGSGVLVTVLSHAANHLRTARELPEDGDERQNRTQQYGYYFIHAHIIARGVGQEMSYARKSRK